MQIGARAGIRNGVSQLRPSAGAVLQRTFALWLHHLPRLAVIAAIIWIPTYLIQLVLATTLGLIGNLATGRAVSSHVVQSGGTMTSSDLASLQSVVTLVGLYLVLSLLVTWVALAASQAALIRAGADADLTGAVAISAALAAVPAGFGRLLAAWAVTVVILLGVAALVIAVGAGFMFIAGWLGAGVLVTAVLVLVLLGLTLVPLAVFARLALAPPMVVLEGSGAMASLRRSNQVLGPYFGMVFLFLVVLGACGWLGSLLFSIPGRLAAGNSQLVISLACAALGAALFAPLPQVGLAVLHRATRTTSRPATRSVDSPDLQK
jgi:hypothetical protein